LASPAKRIYARHQKLCHARSLRPDQDSVPVMIKVG